MDDAKGILGEVAGAVGGIIKKAGDEVVTTIGSMPPKAIQQIAGTTLGPQELEQKKLEEEQKRQAGIAAVQGQLSQRIESNRQQRAQLEDVRQKDQEMPKTTPGLSPLGTRPSVDVGHKLLERKSDKRHG